jgi:hypothetical protein
MKANERDHIKAIGQSKFDAALAKASFCVRSDARLTGLDKIREPLAFEAALRATGFEHRAFTLGKKEIPGDLMQIIDELLPKAEAAAAA